MKTAYFWSRIWCGHRSTGIAWFRIFGWGLLIKDVRTHPLLFSERNGLRCMMRVGEVAIRGLRP